MSFDAPWMLWGLLAMAIPIGIHLMNRQRARKKPFAALDFLLLSDKRLARRLRTKQKLVLLLRVMLFAAIPLALAKPFSKNQSSATPTVSRPGSVVLVIDNSRSMGPFDKDRPSRLDEALERARTLVKSAGTETKFGVISAGQPTQLLTPELSYDHAEILHALGKIELTASVGDMTGALRETERLLASSQDARRQVVILGDRAQHGWRDVKQAWVLRQIPQTTLVTLEGVSSRDNWAITQAIVLSRSGDSGSKRRLKVGVKSFAATRAVLNVAVTIAEKAWVERFDVPAGKEVFRELSIALPQGSVVEGVVELKVQDALLADNRLELVANRLKPLRVLVVNGEPRTIPYLDETFFLRPALESANEHIVTTFVTMDRFKVQSLDVVDVVVLANVGQLSKPHSLLLDGFVRRGGGLLITAGSNLTMRSALSYGRLLPYPIRSIKTLSVSASGGSMSPLRLDRVDGSHPITREFSQGRDLSLFKSVVSGYALLETALSPDSSVLASYSNGAPALAQKKIGRGKGALLNHHCGSSLVRFVSPLQFSSAHPTYCKLSGRS